MANIRESIICYGTESWEEVFDEENFWFDQRTGDTGYGAG